MGQDDSVSISVSASGSAESAAIATRGAKTQLGVTYSSVSAPLPDSDYLMHGKALVVRALLVLAPH